MYYNTQYPEDNYNNAPFQRVQYGRGHRGATGYRNREQQVSQNSYNKPYKQFRPRREYTYTPRYQEWRDPPRYHNKNGGPHKATRDPEPDRHRPSRPNPESQDDVDHPPAQNGHVGTQKRQGRNKKKNNKKKRNNNGENNVRSADNATRPQDRNIGGFRSNNTDFGKLIFQSTKYLALQYHCRNWETLPVGIGARIDSLLDCIQLPCKEVNTASPIDALKSVFKENLHKAALEFLESAVTRTSQILDKCDTTDWEKAIPYLAAKQKRKYGRKVKEAEVDDDIELLRLHFSKDPAATPPNQQQSREVATEM